MRFLMIAISMSAALAAFPAAAQECFWGVLRGERVKLCPDPYSANATDWIIVERAAPTHQYREAPAYTPAPRANVAGSYPQDGVPSPRIRPRIGVGINSNGDVRTSIGAGVSIGILDLGVGFFD